MTMMMTILDLMAKVFDILLEKRYLEWIIIEILCLFKLLIVLHWKNFIMNLFMEK
ncbi:hypothetical protein O3M35_008933 [Rhynocoris fuscipes]|uniref:Uncharacterized protein n=1 Tax=Rhynocoris fuscipes TaxID=488301 RepID=A0AAW1D9B3_9HEMI